jgi:hypothetical protein
VAARAAVKFKDLDKEKLQDFVIRDCPAIAYCEAIAVSTKHFGSSGTLEFSTEVRETLRQQPPSRPHGWVDIKFDPIKLEYKTTFFEEAAELWIIEEGVQIRAVDVLNQALEWWGILLAEIGA